MGMYYNRGRGNLPLTLTEGRSISVPGNSWVELTGADETVASVMRAVRKGQLHRKPERPKKAAKAEPAPKAPAPVPAKAPAKAPEKISPVAPAAVKEEAKTPAPVGEEAAATATADPKPSTAGKSSRRSRKSSSSLD